MTCLAAVGAGQDGFLASAQAAEENLVLDGCPVSCGKKIFEKTGLPFRHLMITDFSVEKRKRPVTPELIETVTVRIRNEVQGGRDTTESAGCCG